MAVCGRQKGTERPLLDLDPSTVSAVGVAGARVRPQRQAPRRPAQHSGGTGGEPVCYEHPDVAGTVLNTAVVDEKQGKYHEALELYHKAEKVFVAVYGHDHLDVASTYCNMGVVYEKQGLYEKALEYYQKDLEITVRVVGHDHLDVAKTRENMANIYLEQEQYDQALEIFKSVLEVKI